MNYTGPLELSRPDQTRPKYQEISLSLRLLHSVSLVLFGCLIANHTVHFISQTFLGQFGRVQTVHLQTQQDQTQVEVL